VVPILILLFDLDAQHAIGTSLIMIVFTALSASFAYYRQRRIDWQIGLMAATTTAPGAIIGGLTTQYVPPRILSIILGGATFLLAAAMLRRSFRNQKAILSRADLANKHEPRKGIWQRQLTDNTGSVFEYDARIPSGLVFLFLGGLASGFLGLGGGLVVVPIFATLVGLPMHIAVATSMLTMIFTSIAGASTHFLLGNVLIDYTAPLVVGILIGTQLGARTARRLKSTGLERAFAIIVLLIGIVLVIRQILGI